MGYMNAIRVAGDLCHMLSFAVLLWKIHRTKSVAGISRKTQELYVLVFLARYCDIFWNHYSVYNSVFKVLFVVLSVGVVYVMRCVEPHRSTYVPDNDAFPARWLVLPCAVLGVAVNPSYGSAFEIAWAFSIYLEAVAILPQLFMIQKHGEVENLTSHYIFCLGLYRCLYIANWAYRYFTEEGYYAPIAWVAGVVQSLLYIDFFYYYVKSKRASFYQPVQISLPI
mmetsp:Transcript_19882/g.66885  ORF Transcript_19882/g.66885 Transcript_19882/m.66885 type:complete len:224 (-) Transcript_19882:563-1234(-)